LLPLWTYRDYLDWTEYYEAEPWGELREDMRNAVLAIWATAPYRSDDTDMPQLIWPYWIDQSPEAQAEKAKTLLAELKDSGSAIHRKISDLADRRQQQLAGGSGTRPRASHCLSGVDE
jgi:hypothetical protein